jgi:Cytotoxic
MSHNNRSGSPQEEKNILVTRGNDGPSSSNPYGSGGGLNNSGRTSSGWTFGLGGGSGGGFSGGFGGSSRKRSRKRAQAVARARAEQQAQAEAAARQIAQQQAEATARQIAQQQAEATARQIAQQQAEATARQIAQQQAEAAARRVVQEQAEAAAQLARQQAAEASRKLEVRAVAEARAQAALAAVVAAPSITPATAAASKVLETAVNLARLQFMARSNRALALILAATYSPKLGDGELRPASSGTPTAPPGIDALGPTTLPAASPFPSRYPGGKVVPNPTQNETLPGVDPADANASIPGLPADEELPASNGVFSLAPRDHDYHQKPKSLPAFPDAKRTTSKTPIQRSRNLRPRWKDRDYIYEWDGQHGAIEKFNKRGRHLGEFDHNTGIQTKPADQTRRIEP